jgi:hypothetical protein
MGSALIGPMSANLDVWWGDLNAANSEFGAVITTLSDYGCLATAAMIRCGIESSSK